MIKSKNKTESEERAARNVRKTRGKAREHKRARRKGERVGSGRVGSPVAARAGVLGRRNTSAAEQYPLIKYITENLSRPAN